MTSTGNEKLGTIKISDEVIAVCTTNAVTRTEGVYGFSGGLSDSFSKNILGKDPIYKGIKIGQTEEGLAIDLYVIVNYGIKIPEVAWNIQENVKQEVELITDIDVHAVNIHVQGVHFKDEED